MGRVVGAVVREAEAGQEQPGPVPVRDLATRAAENLRAGGGVGGSHGEIPPMVVEVAEIVPANIEEPVGEELVGSTGGVDGARRVQ